MRRAIYTLCVNRAFNAETLALLLDRNAHYLKHRYLKPMVADGLLRLTIPDMSKHPNQAYRDSETKA